MLVTKSWLESWVRLPANLDDAVERLTLAGLEVGGVETMAAVSPKVVIGEIVSIEPHPRSDKLGICAVNVGRHRNLSIVCGAPNAREGLKTAVALIGAELPGGIKISKTRIRDIVSSGMMCSSAELGLDDDREGIMELDDSVPNGMLLNEHLELPDKVIDIDLTPNRGDCLSVAGVARELSVLFGVPLGGPKLKPVRGAGRARFPVTVKVAEDCPRYAGRVIEGIDVNARTPDWIRERLRKVGLRPISLAVDITNYVMMEIGQPMHAFDLDRLSRGIVVRHSRKGEEIDLLDGSHVAIPAGTLLIADQRGPVALAGIMGGANSAISDGTRNILLEAACFRSGAIASRARQLGMQTDASYRFERGVDPELQVVAIHRATELLLSAAGGRAGPIVDECDRRLLPGKSEITLRRERLRTMLGTTIPDSDVERVLSRLGMKVRDLRTGWRVTAPSRRYDIEGEHDLVEEVARVIGYDNIPAMPPVLAPVEGIHDESRLDATRLKHALVDRDFREIITYSFVDPELQARVEPDRRVIPLKNPIASNMAVMRTSLWPGLLQSVVANYRRQQRRLRLFEAGHVFLVDGGGTRESMRIGGALTGPWRRDDWSESRDVDYFDMKGDVESLLALGGEFDSYTVVTGKHAALHPGQAARVTRSGKTVGYMGRIHPRLQRQLEIERPVYLFELDVDMLIRSRVPGYRQISRFPATTRDLSIVIADEVPEARLRDTIRVAGGKLLVELELFDIYQGKGIPEGHRSLAYSLTFQDSSRNLTDSEIEEATARIVSTVGKKLGGELRA